MTCPTCLSRSLTLLAWSGRRTGLHGQPNVITTYRCEQGHSFQTVSFFDGSRYQEDHVPFTELLSLIRVCWD